MLYRNFIFTALSTLLIATSAFAQWDFHLIHGWSYANGSDIAYKSNGYPVVAFTVARYNNSNYVYLAQWDGDSWNVNTVYYTSSGSLGAPKLMMTTDDVPFIAYYKSYSSPRVFLSISGTVVTYWDATSAFDVVMNPASTAGNYTIHAVYQRSGTMYYRCYPDPDTEVTIEPNATPGKLAMDSSGDLHLVYYSNTGGGFLKYAYYDGVWSTWTIEPIVRSSSYALVVDDSDNPIVYAQTGSSPDYTVQQIVIQR